MGIFKKTIKYSKPSKDLDSKIKNLDEELKNTGVIQEQNDTENFYVQEYYEEKTPKIYDEVKIEKEETLYNWRESFIAEETNDSPIDVDETYHKTVGRVEDYISESNKELIQIRDQIFQEISESTLLNLPEIKSKIERVLEIYDQIQEGLLNEPPETKNEDPLTPLNQNFVTVEDLNKHYTLFINRIQEQLATIGGGGETKLKYLDDIVGIATNASAYDGKFLKYNHSLGKFEFVTVSGGGGGSQTLDQTLQLGNTSSLGMSVGVVTTPSINFTSGAVLDDIYNDGGFGLKSPANQYATIASNNLQQFVVVDDLRILIGAAYTGDTNNYKYWNFDQNGNITFPDNTIQTTAFVGYANTAGISTNVKGTGNRVLYNSSTDTTTTSSNLTFNGTTLSVNSTPGSNTSSLFLNNTLFGNNTKNGLLGIGTLGFSDTNIIANLTANVNSYAQVILQNLSSGNAASSDFIVNSDSPLGQSYYGDFGINGTAYNGGGPFGDTNGTYLYAAGGTLAVGTNDAQDFRIATGSGPDTPVTRVTVLGTSGNVGIATTLPASTLTVQGNVLVSGVGTFSSLVVGSAVTIASGGIRASGIITASSFRPTSGYIQAPDGTNSFYIYSGNGNVAFQGTIGASQVNNASGYKALDFGTSTSPSVNITNNLIVGAGASVVGVVTASSFSGNASSATYATSSGIATYASTAGIATLSQGLTGIPNISVGVITATDYRIQSASEKTTLVTGNTVSLVYNTGGGNIAICTNPSGDITLNVTGIPTDTSFNNYSLTFSVIVNNTGTARSCTTVNLNGVSKTVRWFGGSLSAAITGVTTTTGYDIYNFTGINTVGSASTTVNYDILGSVNGSYR